MTSRSSLLVVCLLVGVVLAQQPSLGPGRITWWRSRWSPGGLQLSTNNRAVTTATVTFFACFSTDLTSGIVEISLPTGFLAVAGTGQSVSTNGRVVQLSGQSFVAGVDYSVTITGVTTPASVGGYGPFSIRTRYSQTGQLVDANLMFGSVFITGDPNILPSFSVSLASVPVRNAINQSGNILSFKFSLGVTLWKYDTFVLKTDSKWTVSVATTCSSADYAGKVNNFNGSDTINPHSLQCIATPKVTGSSQSVYVYGLAVDEVDPSVSDDNKFVDIRVTGVTTPDAGYPASTFSWTLETYRFGTTTILETGSYAAGPEIRQDNMTSATWTPTWNLPITSLSSGLSLFMDLSFTVKNPLPAGGSIEILFSEDVSTGDTNWMNPVNNCYVVVYLSRDVRCTVGTGSVRLTSLPAIPGSAVIKIRNIVKVTKSQGQTASIRTITTYQSSIAANVQLEVGTSLAPFTVSNTTTTLSAFGMYFHDYTDPLVPLRNYAGGTGNYSQGIQMVIVGNPQGDFLTTTEFMLECPFAGGMEDFRIGVPGNVQYRYTDSSNITKLDMSAETTAVIVPTVSPGFNVSSSTSSLGAISFKGDIGPITSGLHLLLSSTTSYVTLPKVQSNLATAYECYAHAVTSGKLTQHGAVRFYVDTQILANKSWVVPCIDDIDGVPGKFSVKPAVFNIESSSPSRTYYLEIQFPGDFAMSSGLTAISISTPDMADSLYFAVDYPHDKSVQADTVARLYYAAGNNYVDIGGLPTLLVSATEALTIWIPLGGMESSVSPMIRSFFITPSDPRYKFITHEDYAQSIAFLSKTINQFQFATPIGSSDTQINGETHSTGLSLDLSMSAAPIVEYYLYFVFPPGVRWAPVRSVKTLPGLVPYLSVSYFSSPTRLFAFPGLVINMLNPPSTTPLPLPTANAPTTGTIIISGFILPVGSGTGTITAAIGADNQSKACTCVSTISFTTTPGAVIGLSIKPNAVKGRGPDGINIQHTISFTLSHGIPLGGSLQITISDKWQWTTCSSCNVTGLYPAAVGGSVACSYSSGQLTISSFADFAFNTTIPVVVDLGGLLPPPYNATGTGEQLVMGITSLIGTQQIDVLADISGSLVAIASPSSSGNATIIAISASPNFSGAINVDLYLKFSLPHAVPKCGTITVASPYKISVGGSSGCFLSPIKMKDCGAADGKVSLTMNQDYPAGSTLELFLDSSLELPSALSTTGFSISSSWGGSPIDFDQGLSTANILLTPKPASVISGSIGFSPKNAGEKASYLFEFKDGVVADTGDTYWIVFPMQFDFYVADPMQKLANEPTVNYLYCSSPQHLVIACTVWNRVVTITSLSALPADTLIQISIDKVYNPSQTQTDSFQLFHLAAKGEFKSFSQAFGTVAPTALAYNIDVKSLVRTDKRLFKVSDYKWQLYMTDRVNTDSVLRVVFPGEYDLERTDQKDFYSCLSTVYDQSSTATIRAEQLWNPASLCATFGNMVELPAPATSTAFTSLTRVTWTVQGVTNAKWGLPRTPISQGSDFDVTDRLLWPSDSLWSSKFSFFMYRSSRTLQSYTSRSYDNTNSAYAAFTTSGVKQTYVSDSSGPISRITVYAGTQTKDLYLNTGSVGQPLSAKQLVFTASTNERTPDSGHLKYTSVGDKWTMYQGGWRVQFRVAASVDMPKGIYYVDWAIKETRENGRSENQYTQPAATLVEVVARTPRIYAFVIAPVPPVPIGGSSVPIKISVNNAPHTMVLIDIAVFSGGAKIKVKPSTLAFGPDAGERYFQLQVASSYDLTFGNTQKLGFTIGGDDAYAYSIPTTQDFAIVESSSTVSPGSILSWGLSKITQTTATAIPSTDQIGIIYYQLAVAGRIYPTFTALKTAVENLPQSNTTAGIPVASNENSQVVETDPQPNESWTSFQRRLYKTHRSMTWIGSLPILSPSSNSPIPFTFLYSDTEYELVGFLDNLNPASTSPQAYVEKIKTSGMAECQPVNLKFTGSLDQIYNSKVTQELGAAMGVNPLRLMGPSYVTARKRGLETPPASTTLAYTLVASRNADGPTPAEQSKLSTDALATFTAGLKSQGIPNSLDSITQTPAPARQVPKWTMQPSILTSNTTIVSVSLLSSVDGKSCCLALSDQSLSISSEDVLAGVGTANSTCVNTDLTGSQNEVKLNGLASGKKYYVYCTATDTYPLWPTLMKDAPISLAAATLPAKNATAAGSDGRWREWMAALLVLIYA